MKDYKHLIGKPKEIVEDTLENDKVNFRIIREDLAHFIVTQDLRSDRVNLEFDNNILTSCKVG